MSKFESFNDRIQHIQIDVTHKIKRDENAALQTTDCFFREAIKKWKEMNGTRHFSLFLVDIRPFAQSLPQLLHHKSQVVDVLLKHLSVVDTGAYEPLLK